MYKYQNINDVDKYGNSQLMRSSKKGDLKKVKKLLADGCDPNIANTGPLDDKGNPRKGKGGITPLFMAKKHGHKEVVKALIDRGAK